MGQNITKTGHVTLTTTPLGAICHHRLGFDTVYLHAKSDDSSFSHSRGIIEASKFKLGHVFFDPDYAPYEGGFLSLCWEIT